MTADLNTNLAYWKDRYNNMGGKRTVGGKSWSIKQYNKANSRVFTFVRDTTGKVAAKSAGTLVDFGCGIGRCTNFLKDTFKPQKYIGMDIIDKFTETNKDDFYLIPETGYLNIEEASVDIIWTYVVLQHIIDDLLLQYYLEQFWKGLKEGEA